MKLLVWFPLVLGLITAVNAVDQEKMQKIKQEVMKIGTQCVMKEHAGQDDINRFMTNELPKTHEGMCVVSCVQKHLGFQKDDGTFSREGLQEKLEVLKDDKDIYDGILGIYDDVCSKLSLGEDNCENSVQMVKCFLKEIDQRGLPSEFFRI